MTFLNQSYCMHLNQKSCVIFSIFARTSSSKDNYFFKSGCNSQCRSFLQKQTHSPHTVFPTNVPELEIEFWTFCLKPIAGQSWYLNKINLILRCFTSMYFRFFHHEMNITPEKFQAKILQVAC